LHSIMPANERQRNIPASESIHAIDVKLPETHIRLVHNPKQTEIDYE
jgi:hypothetical protein